MGTFTLTELQYSEDRNGPWQLYVYAKDGSGYEVKQWFAKKIEHPDEEVSILDAFCIAMVATSNKRKQEVKVCDGGDMLVYHAKDGKVLYGETFWRDVLKGDK